MTSTIFTKTTRPKVQWGINASLTQTQEVVFTAGTSLSSTLDMNLENLYGYSPIAVFTPSNWTTTTMSIQASFDNTNWYPVHTWLGTTAFNTGGTTAANQCHIIDGYILRGMPYVKFVSGTNGVRVNQVSTAVLTVMCGTI